MRALMVLAFLLVGCGATTHETASPTMAESPRAQPTNETTNHSEAIGSDTDGDGIVAEVDLCHSDPEDFDGFEDGDGCSDRDNDRDGIVDAVDRCPNEPERLDGVVDEDGCPDGPVFSGPVTS